MLDLTFSYHRTFRDPTVADDDVETQTGERQPAGSRPRDRVPLRRNGRKGLQVSLLQGSRGIWGV